MSSILNGVINESHNSVFLTETVTYKLWESAGKKIVEAQLTADQIKQLFANIEQGATSAGGNRTMIGKGVDATSAVNKAWEDLKTKVQNSGPIKNVDAMYDQAAEKLKQATGGDQGVMSYVQKYRDFAKKHPIAQSLIYSALIAAAGISGAGLGGAAALGLFKMVDKLLQGEKFSSAAYSGAKTGAMAYGASKVGDLIKGTQGQAPDGGQIPSGNPSGDAQAAFGGDPNDTMTPWGTMSDEALQRISYQQAVREFINKYAQDPSNPSAQVVKMAKDFAKAKVYGKTMGESLSESTIKLLFSKISLEHSKRVDEGIMDTLKGAAGRAAGAVKQFGTNLTTKVTADKLNSAWEKAGKPTESGEIATLLVKNGVPQDVMLNVFAKMKIPTTSTPAPAATPATAAKPGTPATAAKPAAKPGAPVAQPQKPNTVAPAQPAVNPELQKRLAARKAGTPDYSYGLKEGEDDMSNVTKGLVTEKKKKPKPTSPEKWARAKAKARSKFDVYPSAYANAYASKEYKKMGGGWRMGESIVDLDENMLSTYADMFDLDESSFDSFDSYKRDFKRRELEAEWKREQELTKQREGGHWYIRINGKIFKDRNGDPVMFNGKKHANAVAVKMMQKDFNKGKEFMLTTKPEDKQQDLSEGENVAVIYIDGKPVSKYVNKLEADRDAKLIRAKYPNKKIEIKDEVREAEGDTLMDPEYALPQARKITKAIKYDDTVGEIITQIQMLAERTEGIDSKTLEYSIDGVLAAKNALESAIYDLEEAFEDAARNAQYKRDEEELGEDYTGMFAAEKTAPTNPYGGAKDRQFRGAISETPTDNPTGASGEGGWRTYRAKPAGQLDEEQLDELKCWPGYTRVKGVPAGAVGSCKKKTKESSIMKGINRESK